MAEEKKEYKIRFHHAEDDDYLEVWEVQTKTGKPSIWLGRDTGFIKQNWCYLCDAPDGYNERDRDLEPSITLIICDKDWNEQFRGGNDAELYPDNFPTLEEKSQAEGLTLRSKYPGIIKEGLTEWLEPKMPADISDLDRLNWRHHRSEVVNIEMLHTFTWIGEKCAMFKVTRKHTMCEAAWYEYLTGRENMKKGDAYISFIGYEYGDYITQKELQLIEDEDGSELCYCNGCGCYLIDNNPQVDAKKYDTDIASGELEQLEEPAGEDSPDDTEYYWGCPNCNTDEYLMDV